MRPRERQQNQEHAEPADRVTVSGGTCAPTWRASTMLPAQNNELSSTAGKAGYEPTGRIRGRGAGEAIVIGVGYDLAPDYCCDTSHAAARLQCRHDREVPLAVNMLNIEGLERLDQHAPVVMLNLMRFHAHSRDGDGSGWDAYLRYSAITVPMIKARGGTLLWPAKPRRSRSARTMAVSGISSRWSPTRPSRSSST